MLQKHVHGLAIKLLMAFMVAIGLLASIAAARETEAVSPMCGGQ